MTRGVKIFNKQNYLKMHGVCEKHFIYSFAQFQFFCEVLIFKRFPAFSVNYKGSSFLVFFGARISFSEVVLLAFIYRLPAVVISLLQTIS